MSKLKHYKMKTKKTLAKRVRVTGTGKLKFHHPKTSHRFWHKKTKQKRQLRGTTIMSNSDARRYTHILRG